MTLPIQMQERLGRGSTGTVYRAIWEGREVAVKELHPHLRTDERRREGLRREVEVLRGLEHDRVVRVLAYDEEAGRVVMEYVRGRTLRALLSEPEPRLLPILTALADAAQGLMYIHSRRLVHKDVKPENIFVPESGGAKIGDFGFVERSGGMLGILKRWLGRSRIQGTIAYMAPELLRGSVPSHKSDAFSFGVTLYEGITGRRPFRSTLEEVGGAGVDVPGTAADVVRKILKRDPEPPTRVRPGLPRDLDALVTGLLAKAPESRLEMTNAYIGLRGMVARLQARRAGA